jgi:hypothetical protein
MGFALGDFPTAPADRDEPPAENYSFPFRQSSKNRGRACGLVVSTVQACLTGRVRSPAPAHQPQRGSGVVPVSPKKKLKQPAVRMRLTCLRRRQGGAAPHGTRLGTHLVDAY